MGLPSPNCRECFYLLSRGGFQGPQFAAAFSCLLHHQWAMLAWTTEKSCCRICWSKRIILSTLLQQGSGEMFVLSIKAFFWGEGGVLDIKSWHYLHCKCDHPSFNFRREKTVTFYAFRNKTKIYRSCSCTVICWIGQTQNLLKSFSLIVSKNKPLHAEVSLAVPVRGWNQTLRAFLASPNRQQNPSCAEHLETPASAAQGAAGSRSPGGQPSSALTSRYHCYISSGDLCILPWILTGQYRREHLQGRKILK